MKSKVKLKTSGVILLLLLLPLITTLVCFALSPIPFAEVVKNIIEQPQILLYNLIPVVLITGFLYFISNNIFYSSAITSVIFELLSVINRFKIIYRDEPLVPLDAIQSMDAAGIMKKTNMSIGAEIILLMLIPILFYSVAGLFIKSKKLKISSKIFGLVLIVGISVLFNQTLYTSKDLYKSIKVNGPSFYTTLEYNTKGFIYSFIYNLNTFNTNEPNNYSIESVRQLETKYKSDKTIIPKIKPHVIIVQNEAFTDIALNSNLIFSQKEDPLENYKRIIKESISGYLTVPNFGGGTANTEYDVMTGCMTEDLANTNTSAFRMINKKMNSLATFFTSQGYENLFMHPGDSWFYDRRNVYKLLGMPKQIYGDSFKKLLDYKGLLVSDDAFANKIISEFEKHLENRKSDKSDKSNKNDRNYERNESNNRDVKIESNINKYDESRENDMNFKPWFNFSVSIENHMPYLNGKYGNIKLPQIKTKQPISERAQEYLSNYIYGLRNADASLGKLVEYFKKSTEPVVFVFYGDHLPNLGESYLAYKEINSGINPSGTLNEIVRSYKVPFLVWENEAARKGIGYVESEDNTTQKIITSDKNKELSDKYLGLPENKTISANYLGSLIYDLLGYEGVVPFYDFLGKLRCEVPVIRKDFYSTGDGYVSELSAKNAEMVRNFRIWEYFKVHDEVVFLFQK